MNRLHDARSSTSSMGSSRADAHPAGRPRRDGAARRRAWRREYGCEVAGIVDPAVAARTPADRRRRGWGDVDVAIDFSSPDAVPVNVPALARRGINVVLGTTGWQRARGGAAAGGRGRGHRRRRRAELLDRRRAVRGDRRARGAAVRGRRADFGAWLHEAHHAMKKDAPSGTALLLKRAMEEAGYSTADRRRRRRARASFRARTRSVSTARRNRLRCRTRRAIASAFARGALAAARWVKGRRGWFTMHDVLGTRKSEVRSLKDFRPDCLSDFRLERLR